MSSSVPTSIGDGPPPALPGAAEAPGWLRSAAVELPAGLAERLGPRGPAGATGQPTRSCWLDLRLPGAARADARRAYERLTLRLDGEAKLRPADHPGLLLATDDGRLFGAWTWIPIDALPSDWFGRLHRMELRDGDVGLGEPVERMVPNRADGPLVDHIEDDHGRLILELRGAPGQSGPASVSFLTDPAFGLPSSVTALDPDGASRPIAWEAVGRAVGPLGDTIGNAWQTATFRPQHERVVLAARFRRSGRGFALAMAEGYVRDAALRVDATVL